MSYTNGLDKPSNYFNTITWTADGTSPRSFTGVGFQPDFVWGKRRSVAADHNLYDVVRGAGSNKALMSNSTDAEGNASPSFGYLSSLDSDGFTATTGSTNNNYWNNGTDTYVAWNWLASNTTASNTDGSITSTVSANTTSGFSIGTFSGNATTGATVGHGLGVAPSMFIVKKTNNLGDWYCYHSGIGATAFIKLNETGASATNTLWNNTAPTSSVFSMDSNSAVNGSGDSYVFYAFAEKQGFNKAFSYSGNGSTNGSFVYCGFLPKFILLKANASGYNWLIYDTARNTYNAIGKGLFPDSSNAEYDYGNVIDCVSNGFKFRSTVTNESGISYIGFAIAENPFVTSTGVPTTAR